MIFHFDKARGFGESVVALGLHLLAKFVLLAL